MILKSETNASTNGSDFDDILVLLNGQEIFLYIKY